MATVEVVRSYWGRRVKLVVPTEAVWSMLDRHLPPPPFLSTEDKVGGGQEYETLFELVQEGEGFSVRQDGLEIGMRTRLDFALSDLEHAFQMDLSTKAPLGVFVHSGVVVLGSKALVLPASSYSGKSTLTHALTRRGAIYFSDEYAVVDKDGWIYPYRRALTLRRLGKEDRRVSVSNSHGACPSRCRLGVVVDCGYQKGARWSPEPLSPGEAILFMFANTVSAQLTPERDLRFLAAAMVGASGFRTRRGDVRAVATKFLELLRNS